MKNNLLSIALLAITSLSVAQTNLWKTATKKTNEIVVTDKMQFSNPRLFELNLSSLKNQLINAPQRNVLSRKSSIIVSFPNADGVLENFKIQESSNMEVVLALKYPNIKSYIGQGVENSTAKIYFSISPLGLQTMTIYGDKSATFIEPYTTDLNTYTVYKKADKQASLNKFECRLIQNVQQDVIGDGALLRPNADDGNLRNFRLAMSVTGEYTTYFGGTKALALAAINNTMTRVNGVFENDFGIHMNLIANTDLVIYTNATTDPYSAATAGSGGAWNQELQTALTNTIGSANYDIGHLFGASGGGGNAGCIGCVCKNPTTAVPLGKGSGFTSPNNGIPAGDSFDIDYVAHEMGHQFGGNHTFTFSNEGTIAQVEPGSGSTIMGYAGITGATDVQAHSDPFFHAVTIQQITNYVKTTTCQTTTVTGNFIPTANAGLDYTIPRGTAFKLSGSGTDANSDVLTYQWEQMDKGTVTTTNPKVTATTGPAFRSFTPQTNGDRYFPRLATTQAGLTSWAWEAIPNVARTLNFRFTVRDNRVGGPANNSDDMIVTVNATAGPFAVSSPNTAVSYAGGSTQTVTWAVAGTTSNGVNAANVDILLSTDGGNTYPTVLLAATPNDGTQSVTIPNTSGTTNRIMVRGTGHIFFDISNVNFTISAGSAGSTDTTAPIAPTLVASGTTQNSTVLSWSGATDNVAVTGYDVYQGTTLLGSTASTTYTVGSLTASTAYTFKVRAKDAAGNISVDSNVVNVTTLTPADTTAPTAPTLSASGTTQTSTNLSWSGATDNVGVTAYEVYRGSTLLATVSTTTYAVSGLTAATAYTFTVKAKDAAGNISIASNTVNVTTLAVVTLTYCTSQGNSTADEKIGKVILGTINNTSVGTAGYENFTALSTNTVRGTAYSITVTPSWTSTVFSEGYAVFVDYNKDGDFVDAGETVFTKATSTATTATGSFTIPATASLGATRMRVAMKYNGIPTSCEAIAYGQVEDYTLNIVATAKGTLNLNVNAITLYPNPLKGDVLNIAGVENNATYKILNMLGQEVASGTINNNTILAINISAGTYLLQIASDKGSTIKKFVKE